jgi:tetratricopeptide (TPR) repeat protein
MAFSPDDRLLASGAKDGTVKVWDIVGELELLTLPGHQLEVYAVVFSPDGGRLACAEQNLVKVWDLANGQQSLNLQGHLANVRCVAFSPDGQRLVSGGEDGTVKVWDALSGQEILNLRGGASILTHVVFSPDGRRLACRDFTGGVRVWETQAVSADDLQRREIVTLVKELFDGLPLRSEVLAKLRLDPTLDAATREAALQVAQATSEDPVRLNYFAWEAVRVKGQDRDKYAGAYRQAEAAVQAFPDVGEYLRTLGGAHYRLNRFGDAVETLERSEKLFAIQQGAPDRAGLTFLAMAHYQLEHREEAQATLARLREAIKDRESPREAQDLLNEAEELIEGKAADKKE